VKRTPERADAGPASRIASDFDHLAAFDGGRWDHNRHYHPLLLRSLPARRESALEIGCGTGDFARALARHFERVTAIDLSPEMVRRARELSRGVAHVEFTQADVSSCDLPPESFDCIASIATLHHLPLEDTLKKMRGALRPGGVLLVLDLYQPRTIADFAWSTAAWPCNLVLRTWHHSRLRDPPDVRRAWSEHARHDVYPTLAEVRSLGERLIPGAVVHRHLFWRYSLVWQKPGGHA
jgi:ubiquinone/menaquinone biosynthesis C-methylase UbiE